MAFQYLTPENLKSRYNAAKIYTDQLTDDFPEFERIARNEPHPNIDPAYPKTTDGTTASIIRKTPRRIIQQLPTGAVKSDENDWLTIVASFIFSHRIIPYANEDYALIQKGWSVVEKSLSFGACATYTPFLEHSGYFCPDLTIPYWGDIKLQPGKKSGYACKYLFMRSWWQKADIEALIDSQGKLSKDVEPTWNIEALRETLNEEQTKDNKAQTPAEQNRQSEGIELITGFQVGVGAKFYTFDAKGNVVRTKENKDPRGKIPIDWMYGDTDGSNPLGRGVIELVGGLQNLIDSDMQMYQYNRALMLAPPVIKHGNFSKTKIKFAPNIIIDVGSDPNAKVEPLTIDTTAVANYPALYGLQKSQLLNLLSSPDTSIGTDVGNPGFSKTDAGVKQIQATLSVDDNYVLKMFETWFQNWGETAINLYFAERSGIEELQLDKETAVKLRELPGFDKSLLSDDNKIRIDYDKAETEILTFKVDPSTTSVKDKAAQVESARNLLDLVMQYPQLNSNFGGPIDVDVLSRRLVINSGIDDPEQVAPEPTEAQKAAKEESKNSPNPFSPMFDKPSIRINFPDIPPKAQVAILQAAGVADITEEDVMMGPVADPNMRGVMNPINDPNALLPGGQPGQTNGQEAGQIDIGDIYKLTTDPLIKAQIEKMAGLQPDVGHIVNQVNTNDVQHQASQDQALNPPQPAQAQPAGQQNPQKKTQQPTSQQSQPQPQQQSQSQPQSPQSPEDQQLIQAMQQAGIPDQKIGYGLAMLHSGNFTPEEIMQMVTQQEGAAV